MNATEYRIVTMPDGSTLQAQFDNEHWMLVDWTQTVRAAVWSDYRSRSLDDCLPELMERATS